MIRIKNLKLDFPGRLNLCIDHLAVEKGGVLTIIGPNGAGKSTLLNIIALFQRPDTGSIEVAGENILNLKDKLAFRRKISFIFSQPYLLNDSVYNNIALPLRLRAIADRSAVDEMIEIFKIGHLKPHKANTLSQGEMHRVSLARAFVTKPQLILLDEPFLSLDPNYKASLISQLRDIIHSCGATAIFVTQDREEALSLADDLAVMKDGRILQEASPSQIFTRPASKEVADFVGIETVIEGVIAKKEEALCFIHASGQVLEAVSDYNISDSVFACIRPEDVTLLSKIESSSARNHFKGKIKNIYNTGLYSKVEIDCGFNIVSSVTHRSAKEMNLEKGKEIFVSFKATAVHLIKR